LVGIRSQWDETYDEPNVWPAWRSEDRTLTSVKHCHLSRTLKCAGRSLCPSDDVRSRSLAFAAPSMTLLVAERAFEVFHTSSTGLLPTGVFHPSQVSLSPSKSPFIDCAIRIAHIVTSVSSVPLL
jgi:hypothetical protein